MKDIDCVAFLQWSLPRLALRWPGFRKVRRQVCKRLTRRLRELALADVAAYRRYLDDHPDEWRILDGFCRITISRFCRDRHVFELLAERVLPTLAEAAARDRRTLSAWSAGCGSGEEVYSLRLLWDLALAQDWPETTLQILGTDIDPVLLERARAGCYPPGCLREVPDAWRETAFADRAGLFCLRAEFRHGVAFHQEDIRETMPAGPFDLVLCRNLAFTYFTLSLQAQVLAGIAERMRSGGVLVIGGHEQLPADAEALRFRATARTMWRKD
ncbi:MAG: CheR family methyltransferase [Alphaproteobacteria bacterium]|nr:CheR family methyltransferase [Alphaproteobacteria bacterium]